MKMEPHSARYVAERCAQDIGRDVGEVLEEIFEGRRKSDIDGEIIKMEDIRKESGAFVTSYMRDTIELAILRYTEAWKKFETENKQGQE